MVERRPDDECETSTHIRRLTAKELLARRQMLYPGLSMTLSAMRERLRNACGIEHAEAFFGRAVVLVEGETEQAALPIYAAAMGVDFDALGVSVVSAGGKAGLDALHQLYDGLGFPVFLMFDNDIGGDIRDVRLNAILTRLLGAPEETAPAPCVRSRYAILQRDFENTIRTEIESTHPGLYDRLRSEAVADFGAKAGKPIVARYVARKLTERAIFPPTIRSAVDEIKIMIAPPKPDDDCIAGTWPRDDDEEMPF